MILGNLMGPDIAILLLVVTLLFGASRLPKLAHSLGSASREFRKGVEEGGTDPASVAAAGPGSAAA